MENKEKKIWETRIYIASSCKFTDSEKRQINAVITNIVDSHKENLHYRDCEHNQDVGQMFRAILKWNKEDKAGRFKSSRMTFFNSF